MTHSNKDESLRYPIGRFEFHADYGIDNLRKDIKTISKFPKALKTLLKKIKPGDLKCAYRKGGWTVRQIIHHLADSHMNAYIRMKMALTEPNPVIKTYEEHLWADTEDGSSAPVKLSLKLLSALHERWSYFLKLLTEDDLDRCYFHPEYRRSVPLSEAIALYAWHCRHHLAHINLAIVGQMTSKDFASLPDDPAQAAAKPPVSDDKGPLVASVKVEKKKRVAGLTDGAQAAKMTRAEALAKARAARSEKAAALKAEEAAKAESGPEAPPAKARAPRKSKVASLESAPTPKLTRAEALAKARAARSEKAAAFKKAKTDEKN